ncbi:acylphosphatase [Neptuniibacter sp. 1_MG-2023]|uniref:acylphosphatase n=1 Tax=Neptuniibacter sp. 1_MG-2023 TaxID=3062662 RepID=UPI0026E46498|nr:acylphosphatase [Neptuniibacter sp. 1_MG-2023]MDO6593916.1 acylphosphatase [Neptuniibacter sp. 1_MG-2023]
MTEVCLHAVVIGRVQGVWFRKSTQEYAESLGLSGWVRNLPDSSVELMACGDELGIRQLEAWLSQGPELASVAEVQSRLVALEKLPFPFVVVELE